MPILTGATYLYEVGDDEEARPVEAVRAVHRDQAVSAPPQHLLNPRLEHLLLATAP